MKSFLLFALFFISNTFFAQIGINTTSPRGALEVNSSTNGFIPPQVALTSSTTALPITNPQTGALANGTLVWNSNTINDVTPGYYYWNVTYWEKLVPASQIATLKAIGRERINSSAGTFTIQTGFFVWNSFIGGVPALTTSSVIAPFGSTTSFVTIIPAISASSSDSFSCSKNIISLRFYTTFQISATNNSRWRTQLYLNGLVSGSNQYWGAPPSQNNHRTFGVLEFGPITSGTTIETRIEQNSLPTSTQNASSYYVIEYEL